MRPFFREWGSAPCGGLTSRNRTDLLDEPTLRNGTMLSRTPPALLGAGLLFLLGLTGPAHALLPVQAGGTPPPSLAPMLERVLPALGVPEIYLGFRYIIFQ